MGDDLGEAGWFVFMGDMLCSFKFVAWGCDVANVAAAWTRLGTNSRALRNRLGHSAMQGSSGPANSFVAPHATGWGVHGTPHRAGLDVSRWARLRRGVLPSTLVSSVE